MKSHFFATSARMKYINRWGLMRNTRPENLSEHALEVGMLAHLLCEIQNQRFQGKLNGERAALLGLYHDVSEIYTGDMPTPVKYFNPQIVKEYKEIEAVADQRLLRLLPDDLKPVFTSILLPQEEDRELWLRVKAADKLSALIKCIEEEKMGNREFSKAKQSLLEKIEEMKLPEVQVFLDEFLESYYLTLDELE